MKKLVMWTTILMLSISMLFASGTKEDAVERKTVEILFWHTFSEGDELDSFNRVISHFESANPDIKVNAVRMPFEGLQQQIITAAAGGAAPDAMRMDLTWVGKMASMDTLKALDDFKGFGDIKDNCLDGPMQTTVLNGKHYGLPLGTNTTVSIWNMDLLRKMGLAEPPKTMDELVKCAEAYNNPENEDYFFTIAGTYTWAMLPWFWSLGGHLTNEEFTSASGYLDSAASIEALDTIAKWYQNGIISPAIVGAQPDAWSAATGGILPMTVDGPWFFTSVNAPFEIKATTIPAGKGGSTSIVGGEDVVMFEGTKHPEETWKFIQYLLSDEAQLIMTEGGMIPVTKTAIADMDTTGKEYLDVFKEQLASTKPRTPSANYPEIDSYLTNVFERVVRGEVSAAKALPEAAREVDALLK